MRDRTRIEAARAALTAPGERYELQRIPTPRGEVSWFVNLPQTLRALFEECATDREFLVYDDERLTFRDVVDGAARIAVVLQQRGVRPGDRVAISMRNCPEWMMSFVAATSIGAIAVAMNSLWQTDEMEFALHDSSPTVLLADRERVAQYRSMAAMPVQLVPVRCPEEADDLAVLTAAVGPVAMPLPAPSPDDQAAILYTSGSTGHPKGVLSTHRAMLAALYAWELDGAESAAISAATEPVFPADAPGNDTEASDTQWTALLATPMFHAVGLHAAFLSSWRAQQRLVCMAKWNVEHAVELIERERVNSFSAPSAITGDLVREAQRTGRDLSSLQWVGGGGAARAPEQVRQIGATFTGGGASTGWGMTETNAAGTTISGTDYQQHPDSAGYCLAVVELRVVDEEQRPLPDGQAGELQVRGVPMFTEYWNRPDATAESFTDDGWFRTGDVARLDGELLYIVDRMKDLIIRGGENIGCGHVEAALLAHPQVMEAAVYSVPDERMGEEVGATVYGTPDLDVAELRQFLHQHLAAFEVPRYLLTSAEPLPRTATGKVLKRELRSAAVAELGG